MLDAAAMLFNFINYWGSCGGSRVYSTRRPDSVPAGRVIDAACGTGRYIEYLMQRGRTVVGVDTSEEMLAVARTRMPDCEFRAALWTSFR